MRQNRPPNDNKAWDLVPFSHILDKHSFCFRFLLGNCSVTCGANSNRPTTSNCSFPNTTDYSWVLTHHEVSFRWDANLSTFHACEFVNDTSIQKSCSPTIQWDHGTVYPSKLVCLASPLHCPREFGPRTIFQIWNRRLFESGNVKRRCAEYPTRRPSFDFARQQLVAKTLLFEMRPMDAIQAIRNLYQTSPKADR